MKNSLNKFKFLMALFFAIPTLIFAIQPINYECENGEKFKVAYPDNIHAIMIKNDGNVELFQIAISASGARYINENYQWWTKGDKANLSKLKTKDGDFGILCEEVKK